MSSITVQKSRSHGVEIVPLPAFPPILLVFLSPLLFPPSFFQPSFLPLSPRPLRPREETRKSLPAHATSKKFCSRVGPASPSITRVAHIGNRIMNIDTWELADLMNDSPAVGISVTPRLFEYWGAAATRNGSSLAWCSLTMESRLPCGMTALV